MTGIARREVLAGLAASGWANRALAAARGPIAVARGLPAWFDTIAADLAGDFARTSGVRPQVTRGATPGAGALLCLATSDEAAALPPALRARAAALGGERFLIASLDASPAGLALVAATPAWLRRAVYRFSREVLRLDPTWRWTDLDAPSGSVRLDDATLVEGVAPAFRLRGWFVNDEDLLTEWLPPSGRRDIDYPFYREVASRDAIDRVCETAARLDQNFVVPASFVNIFNPAEAALLDVAARRGLAVSQYHVEPVGVSAFSYTGYWRTRGQRKLFSFYSERAAMTEVWRASIARWAARDTIWVLGLRGVADRPMWMADPAIPRDDWNVGALISDAIATQRALVLEASGGRRAEMVTMMWAEGAALLAGGHLRVPPDVTIVFADNSPGTRMQDDFERPREAGRPYGVYYHQQLWSSGPHLAQFTSPQDAAEVLGRALASGAHDLLLVNASNVREFTPGLTLTAALASGERPAETLGTLSRRWFGAEGAAAERAYRAYFAAFPRHPDDARRPIFLDGLLRQMRLALLKEVAGATDRENAEAAETRRWASKALSVMIPVDPREPTMRARLEAQQRAFAAVVLAAEALRPRLAPTSRSHLDANLITPALMMTGLGQWVLALMNAAGAPADESRRRELAAALAAIRSVEAAGARAGGGQWRSWIAVSARWTCPRWSAPPRRRWPKPNAL